MRRFPLTGVIAAVLLGLPAAPAVAGAAGFTVAPSGGDDTHNIQGPSDGSRWQITGNDVSDLQAEPVEGTAAAQIWLGEWSDRCTVIGCVPTTVHDDGKHNRFESVTEL